VVQLAVVVVRVVVEVVVAQVEVVVVEAPVGEVVEAVINNGVVAIEAGVAVASNDCWTPVAVLMFIWMTFHVEVVFDHVCQQRLIATSNHWNELSA
jgi:hypothetical protein